MSDLSIIPLEDGFETQLAQDWNGATGTVYVLDTPSYTPTTTNTYIVVNPGKTNMQIAEITDYDSTANTLTVSNVTLLKGLGINSTAPASSHATGSKVIISDNYQFWADIQTAINSKLDKNGNNGVTYATTAARDSALGADGVATLPYRSIYVTATGLFYNYNLSANAWQSIDTGTSPANATTSVAGLVRSDVAPAGIPVALIQDNPKYDALAGTSGTPSTSNKYVTNDDTATAATADKVARRLAGGNITVVTEAAGTSDTNAASTAFATTASTKKINITTTDVTVANTTTETNLLSVAIPANTLGTNNAVRARLFVSTTTNQSSDVFALKFKYGTTTIATLSNFDGQNLTLNGYIECYLFGSGATNTQEGNMLVELFQDNVDTTATSNLRNFAVGTATEDSTGALNLVVTVQYSGAVAPSANDNITVSQIVVEKIN